MGYSGKPGEMGKGRICGAEREKELASSVSSVTGVAVGMPSAARRVNSREGGSGKISSRVFVAFVWPWCVWCGYSQASHVWGVRLGRHSSRRSLRHSVRKGRKEVVG